MGDIAVEELIERNHEAAVIARWACATPLFFTLSGADTHPVDMLVPQAKQASVNLLLARKLSRNGLRKALPGRARRRLADYGVAQRVKEAEEAEVVFWM
jgi:hypothetical protein